MPAQDLIHQPMKVGLCGCVAHGKCGNGGDRNRMPAEDKIHNAVRNALIKEGWTITQEPFTIEYESDRFYADICAFREDNVDAVRRVIVVEVKSFAGASPMREFELALGQYEIYRDLLEMNAFAYDLYLAIDSDAYQNLRFDQLFD